MTLEHSGQELDPIPPEARAEIERRLERIEEEQRVRVLYACESGSRAWGFASHDSDYDVRFLFVRPVADYLGLVPPRDVIELPIVDDFDLSGWDLRKALALFRRSNPPLLEWLDSPIVYRESTGLAQKLRELRSAFYSPVASAHHYLHMARGNMRQYLTGDEVWTKRYFYVLRPLLGVLWIERGLGPVPMRFDRLVGELIGDAALRDAIAELVRQKRTGGELRRGPRVEVLSAFLERELQRLETTGVFPKVDPPPIDVLDRLVVETLVAVWGSSVVGVP